MVGGVRVRIPLALALVLLALPGSASAYLIGGHRWPGHRITYFNADRKLSDAVAIAVRAWNTSGVDVRFVKAPRKRAQVVLASGDASRIPLAFPSSIYDSGACAGFADVGWWPGRRAAHVTLDRHCAGLLVSAEVVTHELGHILGLQHPSRGCALMTATPYWRCRQTPKAFQYRCGFIEADDLRGAVRLYGGRIRRRSRFCDVYRKPAPPTNLRVEFVGSSATVIWRNPKLPRVARPEFKQPRLEATVDMNPGACPAKPSAFDFVQPGAAIIAGRDQRTFLARPQESGPWCFTVHVLDEFGRGDSVSTTATIPNVLPVVSFSVMPGFGENGNCIEASDSSYDPDGQLTGWRWDFGAPADADNISDSPVVAGHCYSRPGTYLVTLTVTDNAGERQSRAESVTIPG